MSNSKKLPDLSEKSVESINSGDSRLAANLNINCSEVRRLMNNSSDLIIKYFSSDGHKGGYHLRGYDRKGGACKSDFPSACIRTAENTGR